MDVDVDIDKELILSGDGNFTGYGEKLARYPCLWADIDIGSVHKINQ